MLQPDQGPQQDRLAAAGRADQSQNFAFADIERKTVEHDALAEADHEVLYVNCDAAARHGYIPIDAKNTANSPSSTITRKIDLTTEAVVCWPSDSALPLTLSPSVAATSPITSAMNGAFRMPTSKCVTETASRSRAMKIAGLMPP